MATTGTGADPPEIRRRMLRAVRAVPGVAVSDLAGALGIPGRLALRHLRDLAVEGRIRFERRGLRLRCYPEPGADEGPGASG